MRGDRRFKSERLTCVSAELRLRASCVVLHFRDAEGNSVRGSYGYNFLGMVRSALGLERGEDFANAMGREVIGYYNVNGYLTRLEKTEEVADGE